MPDGGPSKSTGTRALPDGGSETDKIFEDLSLSCLFSVEIYPGGGAFHAGRGTFLCRPVHLHPGRDIFKTDLP